MVAGRPFSILRASYQNQFGGTYHAERNYPLHAHHQIAINEFNKAKRKGLLRNIVSKITKQCNRLFSMDHNSLAGNKQGQHDLGVQTVALDQIVGSIGRADEFYRDFSRRQTYTMERWLRLAKANQRFEILPPIDLVKVGNDYLVADGNHRVSVARAFGQLDIDARVIEVDTAVSLPSPC